LSQVFCDNLLIRLRQLAVENLVGRLSIGLWFCSTISLSFVLLFTGCYGNPSPVDVQAFDPAGSAAKAMSMFDSDGDGSIGGTELEKTPGLKSALAIVDRDSNGSASADEIAARIKKFQADQTALIPFRCQVRLDGKPLSGATIRLVPEPFLEGAVKAATAITDAGGQASLKVDDERLQEFPGVNCGIYRVEISKKDAADRETISAMYNQSTVLGQEVAVDTPDLEHGVVFDLKR
jgi:hypothetical protein